MGLGAVSTMLCRSHLSAGRTGIFDLFFAGSESTGIVVYSERRKFTGGAIGSGGMARVKEYGTNCCMEVMK